MKPVRIFRHMACEGAGYLGEILEQRGIDSQIVCIDEGHAVPMSMDDISGLIFMGGSMSVNDPLGWIADELNLIRAARVAGIPMMGICLGGQLLSKAFEADVTRGANGQEIGWHTVTRIDSDVASSWLGDLPAENMAFHWHGETFSLPEGALHLLASQAYSNQAWVSGNILALQCHPEMTADMVRQWASLNTAEIAQGGVWNQSAEVITSQLDERLAGLHRLAKTLFNSWIDRLGS